MSHPILAIYLKFKFKWASVFYLVAILGAGRGWAKLPGLRITRFRYFHFEKTEELISNCKIATLASRGWRQKMAQHPWSSGKCKSKPQGDTTSYPLRWLESNRQTIPSVGKEVELFECCLQINSSLSLVIDPPVGDEMVSLPCQYGGENSMRTKHTVLFS